MSYKDIEMVGPCKDDRSDYLTNMTRAAMGVLDGQVDTKTVVSALQGAPSVGRQSAITSAKIVNNVINSIVDELYPMTFRGDWLTDDARLQVGMFSD